MATEVGALPEDALAGVFRALPLRSLAAVRCVSKAWRGIVDARWPPLQHLLPRSMRGVFINYIDHERPHHFARPCSPSTIPGVDGMLSFLPNNHDKDWWSVLDHCNGLLLCDIDHSRQLCVCNPATRRWTVLPHRRRADGEHLRHRYAGAYIVFDPAASPHYQVILVPDVPAKARRSMEWPPTPWTLRVFSSRTGRWEERAFAREGMPAGRVGKIRLDPEIPCDEGRWRYAVYNHGSLYVHCRGSFVTRLSLADSNYQVIETPANIEFTKPYLGKLQNSVCFGIVHKRRLKIWILNESCGQMEWLLKYEAKVGPYARYVASIPYDHSSGRQQDGSWIVEENDDTDNTDHNVESQLSEESYDWDSDNNDTFTVDVQSQEDFHDLAILGFHPYKEVVFMVQPFGVVAYHLNSTKIQYLGNSRPKCYYRSHWNGIYESFLYTPCMIGHLLHGDQTG